MTKLIVAFRSFANAPDESTEVSLTVYTRFVSRTSDRVYLHKLTNVNTSDQHACSDFIRNPNICLEYSQVTCVQDKRFALKCKHYVNSYWLKTLYSSEAQYLTSETEMCN